MNETNDEPLQRQTRRKVSFVKSLYSYAVVILFLWLVWWFTSGRLTGFTGTPWPVWVMFGWGLSLAMEYFSSYRGSKKDLANEEFENLKKKQESPNT